jgi:hypothetical protein
MSRWQRAAAAAGLLLLLLYALPLFVPPPATYPAPSAPDAGLWQRMFPGVPSWWVADRLLCLFLGAVSMAACVRVRFPIHLGEVSAAPAAPASPRLRSAQWGAVMLALAQAVCGLFATHFGRLAETLYFLCLPLPAGLLALVEPQAGLRSLRRVLPRLGALLIVPLLWLAVSVPTAWRSPRAASVVDMWIMVDRLAEVVSGHQHVLADSASPGHTNAYMMLEGVSLIGPHGLSLSFVQLQMFHLLWPVVCAVALGVIAWSTVGRAAAVVAQAVFLFSQFVLSAPFIPGLYVIGALCTAVLLLLVLVVRRYRSTAALVAFGAVVGFSSTEPTVALVVVLLSALMARSVSQWSPVPWLAVAAAILACVAAVLPGLPHPETLSSMAQYTFGRGQMARFVELLFGQVSVLAKTSSPGKPALLDIPVGALLAPFAIARTPLRLLGDALLDPVGTALTGIGLALCVLHVTRSRWSALLLGLLAAALAHAFTSTGDAVSHIRLGAALVPLALLAAIGFEAIRVTCVSVAPAAVIAAVTVVMVATAGTILFEAVNPSILPASWLTVSLEALGDQGSGVEAIVLEHGDVPWLYVDRIATLLPTQALPVLTAIQFERMDPTAAAETRRAYFWSPALEQDAGVSCLICARWPEAALYTLRDKAGLFRAFAAAPHGTDWSPRLPSERWTLSFCDIPMCRPDGAGWPALGTSTAVP